MSRTALPGGLPGLGHLVPFLRDGLKFVTDLHDQTGVVPLSIGPMKLYALTDPGLVHAVLSDGRFTREKVFEVVKRFADPASIISTSGALHSHDRNVLRKAFSKAHLHATVPVFQETTRDLLKEWRPGSTADVAQWSDTLTFSMFMRSLMASGFPQEQCRAVATAVPVLTGELV